MLLSKIFKSVFIVFGLTVIGMFGWRYFNKTQEVALSTPSHNVSDLKSASLEKNYLVRSKISVARETEIKEEYAGTTEPYREVNLDAQISGRIKKIRVREGDFVRQGDILFTLYDDDRTNKLMSARAEVALRKMQYIAAQKLEAKKFTSPISLATAYNNLEKANLGLKKAELNYARLKVAAPFDGVVNKIFVEPNAILSDSMMDLKLCRIVALSPLFVTIEVPERAYEQLRSLKTVYVRLADNREIEGEIVFVSSVANEKTKTFKVKIQINNSDLMLPAGMSVSVVLPLTFSNVHEISPSWIALSGEGVAGIMAIVSEKTRFMPVQIVRATKSTFFVTGLPSQLRIITLGQNVIQDGTGVRYENSDV